jgi:sugar O-acyltransferase (sialic acid O-acetyltransferase NeuD family)
MKRLAIVGAGDLGVQLAHLAAVTGNFVLSGFFDDTHRPGAIVANAPVLGDVRSIEHIHARGGFDCLTIAIGYKHIGFRQSLHARFSGFIPLATIVHPSAIIDPTCTLGEGVVVYTGCVLDMGVRIGANTLVNAGCVVGHDSEIAQDCFLSPAVAIAGFVTVNPGCVLGIGTTVIDNISIASGTRTGAGAVVTRDIDRPGLYLGIPARFTKDVTTR